MRSAKLSVPVLVATVLPAGCTSTHLDHTWRDPNFSGPIAFKKTLAVAIYKDVTVRRDAEDAMVRAIGSDRAVAAYQVMADTDRATASALEAKAKSIRADGYFAMRIIGTRTQTNWVPPEPGFGPFYDRATMDDSNVDKAVGQIANAVRAELQKEKLLAA
jgi:hypothetical protein